MANWTNSDGLEVKFGLDAAKQGRVMGGHENELYISAVLDFSDMNLTGGRIDSDNPVIIPAGSYITQAFFVVVTAFDSGSTATLDLGLSLADGTYTGADEDGIDVAIAETAIDTAGKVVVCDGALVRGTAVTSTTLDLYPSFDVDTAAYTVGKGVLHIFYLPPNTPAGS